MQSAPSPAQLRRRNCTGRARAWLALSALCLSGGSQAAIEYDISQDQQSSWSGYVSAGYARNSYSSESINSFEAFNFDARVSYKTDFGQWLLTVGGEQETLHGQEPSFYDPFFEFRTPLHQINDTWSVKGSVGVYLPGSRLSDKQRLEYAPRLASYLFWTPDEAWNFYLSPRYQYNSYKYKTAGEEVLTEHQFDLVADGLWQFSKHWYIEVNGRYRWAQNYYGKGLDDSFIFAQELGWEFMPSTVVAIGHNNSGRFYNPERASYQGFEFYNKKSSTFYMSVTKYL
ncbi:hypothetical protein [Ferrimonas sp. SCSIO 43195]|uniref:hypothetical protein n=1 Tax=Ferrimonas sp. SCSIO 43195 TaxID=2822844 RepID=UPI002074C3E8|nr:hypothetical protein [Ferrimonas sp. SCSIO 43195]USD38713.1 hypothetical protein J8Z22_06310 [Ferrimonas sp. SCSIO 43195]